MDVNKLRAISPVDGRYAGKTAVLGNYFSEYALIRARVTVEIEYLLALLDLGLHGLPPADPDLRNYLSGIASGFSMDDAILIKEKESVTNHDVKAVEYFLADKISEKGHHQLVNFIHFGLTSQDINNTAQPMLNMLAVKEVMIPKIHNVLDRLKELSVGWKDIPMLSRTHGQPASPTLLGKEILVFIDRIENQLNDLAQVSFSAKFGGATGNFNAHHIAYPEVDWVAFSNKFLEEKLGLKRQQYTTQIEQYDDMAALFQVFQRLNNILMDLCRDIWTYISFDYFKQKIAKGEVGSSTMPHKVNPIDFENAEGNLGMAGAIFGHLANKLPISRLQRDLTDSTVSRNIGVPFAHSLIAWESLLKGLGKLVLNPVKINADLENNWAILAEAIQTVLRKEGYPEPYEKLKELTRTNTTINKEVIQGFIDGLDISPVMKDALKNLSPQTYTGKL